MSNTESNPALFESYECPIVDGHRLIQRLSSRKAEVGGIPINRVLPQRGRRMIGAWCFLDHAGPAVFSMDSKGMRVGSHPHTCLQTFTWMLDGDILHRDSLGSEQVIRPGEVNLMTAGRGIAHTEESLSSASKLHAAQLWIALPYAHRHTRPRFDHYPNLPRWQEQGVDITLLIGALNGREAPTLAFSPLVGADIYAEKEATVSLVLHNYYEYGILVLEGSMSIDQDTFSPNELAYLGCGINTVTLTLTPYTRVLLLGGEPLNEEIFIWWNFVGHSKADIIQAQREWEAGDARFGEVPTFEGDRMMPPPLPWRA